MDLHAEGHWFDPHPQMFPSLWHFVAQWGSMFGLRAAKGLSCRFRVDSGMNLIKQTEIVGPYTVSSPVTCVSPCSGSEQQKPQPLLMWTHKFAKYSSWDAVNLRKYIKSIRDYDPAIPGFTQQTPGRYLCCKSICTNIIFSWWETT